MRKTPGAANYVLLGASLLVFGVASAKATVLDVSSADVVGGVTVWRGVQNTAQTAYLTDTGGKAGVAVVGVADQQTGQNVSDLVGTTTAPTLYIGYGTISNVDYIGFRVRLNTVSLTNGQNPTADPGGLKQVTYVGFDFDNNGVADMVVGANLQAEQSSNWRVVIADTDNTKANTSPSTTGIIYGQSITPIYQLTTNGNDSYVNYQQVTSTNSTVGGSTAISGDADAFLTFALPYASFVAAIQSTSVMGSSFSFDANTTYRITAGTSQQENNINQDAMGDMDVAFNFSAPISTSGSAIPEPASVAVFGALMIPVGAVMARRRWQKRADASNLQS